MFECFPTSHYLYFCFTKEETGARRDKGLCPESHETVWLWSPHRNHHARFPLTVPVPAHSWLQGTASILGPCLLLCHKVLYRVAQKEPCLTPSSPLKSWATNKPQSPSFLSYAILSASSVRAACSALAMAPPSTRRICSVFQSLRRLHRLLVPAT